MTAPLITVGEAVSQARTNVFVQDAPITGVRRLVGVALGVNINAGSTDTAVTLLLLSGTNFVVRSVMVNNAVVTNGAIVTNAATTATAGLFTAVSGGGVALVANAALSGLTALTGSGSNLDMTMATQAVTLNQTTQVNLLYFRVGTAQGASTSATADVYIWADVLP